MLRSQALFQVIRRAMEVHPIKALEDNYMYLVFDKNKKGFVVDPVEAARIQEYADKLQVDVLAALVTHHHYDHAGGMNEFYKIHKARNNEVPIYGGDKRIERLSYDVTMGTKFFVGNMEVSCLSTPCHTRGHICYYVNTPGAAPSVFTGDTLFIGGCGRFFEGTAEQMVKNLTETLGNLPGNTQVWCGHEYTVNNLKFALSVEPNNKEAKEKLEYAKEQGKGEIPTVPSTIDEEKSFNPFMRLTSKEIQKNIGMDITKPDPYEFSEAAKLKVEVMQRLREAKNKFI